MVRYPQGHKERTREQIVESAARAFREQGVDGVSVGEVMRRAGLTHGGFYAHFANKDALVAESCKCALDESTRHLRRAAAAAPPERRLAAVIAAYVSERHRDDPGTGCLLPTMSPEIARGGQPVRDAFTEQVKRSLANLGAMLPADTSAEEREARAIALLAGMVGSVMMARAVSDPELSDRILESGRDFLVGAFNPPPAPEDA